MRRDPLRFSRRQIFLLAGSAVRVGAAADDFWNTKPPAEWIASDIYRLMNSSPWAVSTNWWEISGNGLTTGPTGPTGSTGPDAEAHSNGGLSRGGQLPPGEGPRRKGPKVVVTWEGAQPIRDAMKTPPPPEDAPYYVIGVDGIPPGGVSLDDLKRFAVLRSMRKPKWTVRAWAAHEIIRNSSIYEFGFPKPTPLIGAHTAEARFEIDFEVSRQQSSGGIAARAQAGVKWSLQAKFKPKDMLYHGQLAL